MNGSSATLRVNTAHYGLKAGVLGATNDRALLVTQGCSHVKCPGCTSPRTWSADGGELTTVDALLAWMKRLPRLAGLTITGGEPTDQSAALVVLLEAFRKAFPAAEVVLYSALTWKKLGKYHAELVDLCDVVIAGPFVRGLPPTPLAGSSNQTVHLLTPRAEHLYAGWQDWPLHQMQIKQKRPGELLLVGIPSRDMPAALTALNMDNTEM